MLSSILSLVSMLFHSSNGRPHREETTIYAENRQRQPQVENFGITYGRGNKPTPNNMMNNHHHGLPRFITIRSSNGGRFHERGRGDGIVVVRTNRMKFGRAIAMNLHVKSFASKAGGSSTSRGSEVERLHNQSEIPMNIKSISNLKNLTAAYELIKSNPGNMTAGTENTTLDGISRDYLLRIQERIKAGTFDFKPARRVQIPKAGSKEKRPLSIASPREKVIQKAVQLVLEPYFEALFLENSHGFRPHKGTRTAIQYVDAHFQSAQYIIEADFSQAFPSIPHVGLMALLKQHIKCEKTLRLISSGLKAGHVEFGKLHQSFEIGRPQGSILSPLLCNIYLHQLDLFMVKIMEEFNVGKKKKIDKKCMAVQNKLKY